MSVTSDLLTVAEVARMFRVDDTTVRRWIKQGALEAVPLPKRGTHQGYRVRRETVDSLLGAQKDMQHEADSTIHQTND